MRLTPVVGGLGLMVFAALAVLGPDLVGHDPARQVLSKARLPVGSEGHLLGTDHLGRDMAARLLAGARITLSMAALAVITAGGFGVLMGIAAGWLGGWADRLLSGLADAILALPGLLLVLVMAAIHPGSWWTLYVGLSLTLWVEFFRVSRARSRILIAAPAVEAARLLGLGPVHIFRRHLWPDLRGQILVLSAFGAATVVTGLATLGFISVGLRPPTPEWGVMMAELLPTWREAPWLILSPIVALALLVACLRAVIVGVGEQAP